MLAHQLQAQSHHHPISNQRKLLSYTRIALKYLSHRQSSDLPWPRGRALPSVLGHPNYTLWSLSTGAMRPLKSKRWNELSA